MHLRTIRNREREHLREQHRPHHGLHRTEDSRQAAGQLGVRAAGMRGDGDLPMSESANIALLEQIVTDQR